MQPFLSVCMIVKNEEKVLKRCLESLRGIADEIIIADTGSTDRTKKIAEEFTDAVYDYKWVNDFSKARNFAASKASGEWILAMDADEYVDREEFSEFKKALLINPPLADILAVQIVNFVGLHGAETVLNYHERMYRNNGELSYFRSIHELIKSSRGNEKRALIDLNVYHSGYLKEVVAEKNKSERNLTLLKNKKNREPIDYYFLGNEYSQLGMLEKAIESYKKGYQQKEDMHIDWVKKLLVRLVSCLHTLNRDQEALQINEGCIEFYFNLVDFRFLKGKILFDQRKSTEAIKIFNEILQSKDNLIADSSTDYLGYLPHRYLGELYEQQNELQLAVHHYSKALALNDTDDNLWIKLIGLLGKHSRDDEFLQFIENKCLKRHNMSLVRLIKILVAVPIKKVQNLSNNFNQDNRLTVVERHALLLKNSMLNGQYEELTKELSACQLNKIISTLSIGIFSIVDYILLALVSNNQILKSNLNKFKFDVPIDNLINMLLGKQNKRLSVQEEELFFSLFKQAYVLNNSMLIELLKKKRQYLGKDKRLMLKELM
ncbi:glycosyltransferase [Rossellomorea marisflavi]|uniref:glycosyltransferase n=1 Tax=Rossellomorea marisflavi TaxID=189381 RepID=UPI0020792949|nr:glycosyltransferase family 2 protein [Rossellomorea marisflavi]USK91624.1 glycosyltransferase [Rossellomorea marisflavi]